MRIASVGLAIASGHNGLTPFDRGLPNKKEGKIFAREGEAGSSK